MYRVVICNTVRLVLTARMLGDFLPKLAFLDNVLRAGLRAEVRSVAASQKSFYYKMLEEDRDRAKNPEEQPSADVMDVLLNVQDPSGEALKDKKIVAMVRTMIVGGTDTSAMSLTRVMEDLLREPKYLQMAHQELDQVVGHDRKVEESDLPNLPLLRAIIKESWRRSTFGSGMLLPRCATHLRHAGGRLRHPRQHHSPGEHPRHFPRSSRLARPPSLLPRKIPAKAGHRCQRTALRISGVWVRPQIVSRCQLGDAHG